MALCPHLWPFDTNPARWSIRQVDNKSSRPFAIVTPDGPHGDEFIATGLSERDARLLLWGVLDRTV